MKVNTILPMMDTAGKVGNQVDGIRVTCHLMISKARLGGGNDTAILIVINEKQAARSLLQVLYGCLFPSNLVVGWLCGQAERLFYTPG